MKRREYHLSLLHFFWVISFQFTSIHLVYFGQCSLFQSIWSNSDYSSSLWSNKDIWPIASNSVHFTPIWSNLVHLVHFYPFGTLQSTLVLSIYFSPFWTNYAFKLIIFVSYSWWPFFWKPSGWKSPMMRAIRNWLYK